MGPGMFDGLAALFKLMGLSLLLLGPLGLWKLGEIVLWVWSNLHWGSP